MKSRRGEQRGKVAHAVTKGSPNIITAFESHIAKTRHFEGLGSVLVDAADDVHVTERSARVRHLRTTFGGGNSGPVGGGGNSGVHDSTRGGGERENAEGGKSCA